MLLDDVRRIQTRRHRRHGLLRMPPSLAEGRDCIREGVERLMRRNVILALADRQFRPRTTGNRYKSPIARAAVSHPCAEPLRLPDITYIAIGED